MKRDPKVLESEAKYRSKPIVKEYQKQYGRLYRALVRGELSLVEFESLKPVMKMSK